MGKKSMKYEAAGSKLGPGLLLLLKLCNSALHYRPEVSNQTLRGGRRKRCHVYLSLATSTGTLAFCSGFSVVPHQSGQSPMLGL